MYGNGDILADAAIRESKALDKPCMMFDSNVLFLLLTMAGGKLCRFRCQKIGGKKKLLRIGSYLEVTLAAAQACASAHGMCWPMSSLARRAPSPRSSSLRAFSPSPRSAGKGSSSPQSPRR